MKADLHVHTKYSDGRLSLHEIQVRASGYGIDWVVAADHDTLISQYPGGCDQEASSHRMYAVEVTASCKQEDIHVLGYFGRHPGHEFVEFLVSQRILWNLRFRKMWQDAKVFGHPPYKFNMGSFQSMMDDLAERECGSRPGVYRKYFALGRPFHMCGGRLPSVGEVISLINDAGGISVIAHPGMGELGAKLTPKEVAGLKVEFGLQGVEVNTPFHTPETSKEFRKLAVDTGMLITGGSDFHCDQWQAVIDAENRGGFGVSYIEGDDVDCFCDALFG